MTRDLLETKSPSPVFGQIACRVTVMKTGQRDVLGDIEIGDPGVSFKDATDSTPHLEVLVVVRAQPILVLKAYRSAGRLLESLQDRDKLAGLE